MVRGLLLGLLIASVGSTINKAAIAPGTADFHSIAATAETNTVLATIAPQSNSYSYISSGLLKNISAIALNMYFDSDRFLCSNSSDYLLNNCIDSDSNTLTHPAPQTTGVTSPFGWRNRPYSGAIQFHQGIDYGAPIGSPVIAASSGVVVEVVSGCNDFGNKLCGGQMGNWITIDRGDGMLLTYGHLQKNSLTLKKGMKVFKHQQIARVGSSGWSTGAHLDFRIEVDGEYQNPADFVK